MAIATKKSKNARYILLIEDNVFHAELVTEILDRYFSPVVIHTVDEIRAGIDFASEISYDLILMDAMIQGELMIKMIPTLLKTADHSPLIVITGSGDEQLAAEAIKAGACEYLVKSKSSLEKLPAIIENVLKKRRGKKDRKLLTKKMATLYDSTSPTDILREIDKLTEQMISIAGSSAKKNVIRMEPAEFDQILVQTLRLREIAEKLLDKLA